MPSRSTSHAHFLVASIVALAVSLTACSGANLPASPTPSASPAPAAASSATVNEPQTIHLTEQPTNVSEVRVGSLTGCTNTTSCQGDHIVGNDPMVEVSTGEKVGSLAFECFIVDAGDTLYHCPGITLTLTGRGQIVFTEFFWAGVTRPETSPITGGTGEFLGVTGTVTSQRGGDFVITISE